MGLDSYLDLAQRSLGHGAERGVLHLYHGGEEFSGRVVEIDGKSMLNFGSCSYLGLEKHPKLVEACIEATQKFGTQLSSSRAYLSSGQYLELEQLLENLFEKPVLVTPSTSLGHLAAFQSLFERTDLIVLDHQAHASLHAAAQYMKGAGNQVRLIRHNDLAKLEKILDSNRHQRVWYCIDGVYSMYGDWAPIEKIYELADHYANLHIYADDAHGFSWFGEHGKGTVRGRVEHHDRLVLAVSLNKAFGCAGGALVFADSQGKQRVRTVGNSLVFSGPVQPPLLGAAIASAKLHLSCDFALLQSQLMGKIALTEKLLAQAELPDLSHANTPIFYIAIGSLDAGYCIIERMMNAGFYLNLGLFPAVSIHRTGIRITINNHLGNDDIRRMIAHLSKVYREVCNEFAISQNELSTAFQMNLPTKLAAPDSNSALRVQVLQQPPSNWDDYLCEGMPNAERLSAIAQAMQGPEPENRWQLFYLRVMSGHTVVLQSLACNCLIKADMFADPAISEKAENARRNARYAYCQKVLMTNTPISEGNCITLTDHPKADEALKLFVSALETLKTTCDSQTILIRDLDAGDPIINKLSGYGLLPVNTMPRHFYAKPSQYNNDQYLANLGKKNRQHWQKTIGTYRLEYDLSAPASLSDKELEAFYPLYLAVQSKAMEICTFALPTALLKAYNELENSLWLVGKRHGTIAYAILSYQQNNVLHPLAIGMNYQYKPQAVYRVALHHCFEYAKVHQLERVDMGFGAGFEKRRLGCVTQDTVHLVRSDDDFLLQSLNTL